MSHYSKSIDSHLVNKMNRVLHRHLNVMLEVSPRKKRSEVTGAASLRDGRIPDAGMVAQKENTPDYTVDFNPENLPGWGREHTLSLKDMLQKAFLFAECSLRMAGNLAVRSLPDGSVALQVPAWELEYKVELTNEPTTCYVVLVQNQDKRGEQFLVNHWRRTGEFRAGYDYSAWGKPFSAILVEKRRKESTQCLNRMQLW